MNRKRLPTLLVPLLVALLAPGANAQTFEKTQPLAAAVPPELIDKQPDSNAIVHGAYIARAADCMACHTAKGGQPYAGGVAFETQFGTMYSPNITSDKDHGIGNWTLTDFSNAVKHGKRRDGSHLYPSMPYTAYTKIPDKDIADLWAYFQHVTPQSTANRDNDLHWPFSWRGAMWFWNALFFDDGSFKPDSDRSDQFNRGKYLVEGPGHCGSCHSPRNFAMAEKTSQAYTGNTIQGWTAPSLVSGNGQPLDSWSVDDVAHFLATGRARNQVASGSMQEAIHDGLQYLKPADINAIALYLKSLQYDDGKTVELDQDQDQKLDTAASARHPAWVTPATAAPAAPAGEEIGKADGTLSPGEALYMNNCMACHQGGQGMPGAVPTLIGNPDVSSADASNLLQLILHGTQSVQNVNDPAVLTMPNFDWRLSDQQIATLATYVRQRFGKLPADKATVDADKVGKLRH